MTSLQHGQAVTDTRTFIDNNEVNFSVEVSKYDDTRQAPTKIADRSWTIHAKDWANFTIAQFKEKLAGVLPPSSKGGFFVYHGHLVPFSEEATVDSVGFRANDREVNSSLCFFDLDTSAPAQPAAAPVQRRTSSNALPQVEAAPEPAAIPSSVELRVDVSIFLDAGNNYVTIVAKNDSHKVNVENKFAIGDKYWNTVTVRELKLKAGTRFPKTLSAGVFVTPYGKKAVIDTDKLWQLGVHGDKGISKSFVFLFEIAEAGAAAESKRINLADAVPLLNQEAAPELDPLLAYKLGVRVALSEGNVQLTLTGSGIGMPNGVKDALMNKMTFSNVRLVDLKNLIVGEKWPTLEKGWGDNGLVKVLDTTKLASIGFSFESGHAVKYTFFFLRDAKANLPEGANAADLAKSTDDLSKVPTEISVSFENSVYVVAVKSNAPSFQRQQDVRVPANQWASLSFGDLKARLGRLWTFKAGGSFNGKSFSDGSLVADVLGVKGTPTKTQTYSVTFVLGVASSVSAADSAAFSVVPPSSPFVAPVQKNPLEVEVRVFEDNGIHFLSLSAKMGSTVRDKEIRIPDDDYVKLTWGDVKARLDTHWPKSTNVGYYPRAKLVFTDQKRLSECGIVSDPLRTMKYTVVWDLEEAIPLTPRSAAGVSVSGPSNVEVYRREKYDFVHHEAEPRLKRGNSLLGRYSLAPGMLKANDVSIEFRIFLDGANVEVQVQGRGEVNGFSIIKEARFTVPTKDWSDFTWGAFKKQLTHGWPKFEANGFLIKHGGSRDQFTDADKLVDLGIVSDAVHTRVFDIVLTATAEQVPESPRKATIVPEKIVTPTSSSGSAAPGVIVDVWKHEKGIDFTAKPDTHPALKHSQSIARIPQQHSLPSNVISVDVRLFLDNGSVNVNVEGKGIVHGHYFVKDIDFAVKVAQWDEMTWSNFKTRLGSSWPQLKDTIAVLDGTTKKTFLDSDKVVQSGLVANAVRTVVYDVLFDAV